MCNLFVFNFFICNFFFKKKARKTHNGKAIDNQWPIELIKVITPLKGDIEIKRCRRNNCDF